MNKTATSPPARSGRFSSGPAPEVAAFTQSVSFDCRLWKHDLLGSMVHATMLSKIGVLTPAEHRAIVAGLEAIGQDIAAGRFVWRTDLEDVHMNIEAELTRRVPAGAKLHTGRSRNDQVALDLRLWLREELVAQQAAVRRLQTALVDRAERHQQVWMPGYTHLQRAQPVSFAHHLLAYVEMFDRDHARLGDAFARVNVCPLGAGALAGSTLPLDRELVARLLGFVDRHGRPRLCQNSMDAVSDRDFAVEYAAAAALIAVHLSRLGEDLVLWSSAEFGFIRLADAFTTGSSLMPQKRNPDVAELVRGKAGRVFGHLTALLTLLKGLPLTYNRDLQEDKEPLFDTADTVRACLDITTALLGHLTVNPAACAAAVADPTLLATDLAEYLVQRGVPFRQAHHAVGLAVAAAEKAGKRLDQLSLAELQAIHCGFEADALEVFDLDRAVRRRETVGASGPRQIRRQLARWRSRLREATPTTPDPAALPPVPAAARRQSRGRSRRR